jgi:hypothetical protein
VYDGSDQFQERNYVFNFTDVQPDPTWPCLNDLTKVIDPPYLIDPLQSIVNWSGSPYILVEMYWTLRYPTGYSGYTTGEPTDTNLSGPLYCLITCSDQPGDQYVTAAPTFGPNGDFTGSSGLGNSSISLGGGWSGDSPNSWSTSDFGPTTKVGTAPYWGGAYGTQPSWNWSQGSPAPGSVPQAQLPTADPWSSWGTNFSGSLKFTGDKPISGFRHGALIFPPFGPSDYDLAAECQETTASISTPAVPTIVWNGSACTPIGALATGNFFYIMYKPGT